MAMMFDISKIDSSFPDAGIRIRTETGRYEVWEDGTCLVSYLIGNQWSNTTSINPAEILALGVGESDNEEIIEVFGKPLGEFFDENDPDWFQLEVNNPTL